MSGDTQAPDPDDIQYLADLLKGLAGLRTLSYKKFEDASKQLSPRAGYPVLAKTTVYNMLNGNRFPTEERLLSYLVVCEIPAAERQRWLTAHRRARANHDRATGSVPDDPSDFGIPVGVHAPETERNGPESSAPPGSERRGEHSTREPPGSEPPVGEPSDDGPALTASSGSAPERRIRVLRPVPTSTTIGASAYRAHRGRSRGPASRWLAGKRCMFVGSGATLAIVGLVVGCYYAVVPQERVRSFRVDESVLTYRSPDDAGSAHIGHLDRGVYEFSCWAEGTAHSERDPVEKRRYDSDVWVRTPLDSEDQRDVYLSDLHLRLFDERHPDVRALLPECSWSVFG